MVLASVLDAFTTDKPWRRNQQRRPGADDARSRSWRVHASAAKGMLVGK
jgi:hypothetical protein